MRSIHIILVIQVIAAKLVYLIMLAMLVNFQKLNFSARNLPENGLNESSDYQSLGIKLQVDYITLKM